MQIPYCKEHRFFPINGTLFYCQAQNFKQGCIHLTFKSAVNVHIERCMRGKRKGRIVPINSTCQMGKQFYCPLCDFCPQGSDLQRCLAQNNHAGCRQLGLFPREHPRIPGYISQKQKLRRKSNKNRHRKNHGNRKSFRKFARRKKWA